MGIAFPTKDLDQTIKKDAPYKPYQTIIRQLYLKQVLQGVEVATFASFCGSRTHMNLMMNAVQPDDDGEVGTDVFQAIWEVGAPIPPECSTFFKDFSQIEKADEDVATNIASAFEKHKWKVFATEIIVFDPFRLYLSDSSYKLFQTRADFIAVHKDNNNIILGDYKTRWGMQTQSKFQERDDWRQVIINAYFTMVVYNLPIDIVAVAYGNLNGEVFIFEKEFNLQDPLIRTIIEQALSPRTAMAYVDKRGIMLNVQHVYDNATAADPHEPDRGRVVQGMPHTWGLRLVHLNNPRRAMRYFPLDATLTVTGRRHLRGARSTQPMKMQAA